MKERLVRLWESGKQVAVSQNGQGLERTYAGRLVNALTFFIIIFCLAAWITIFLSIKEFLFAGTFSGNALTNLTCITFFGGLVLAIFAGAMAGNFLRRIFWKWLLKQKDRQM